MEKTNKYTCKNCIYFIQHYALFNGHLLKTDYGHCSNTYHGRFRKTNISCEEFKLLTKSQKLKQDKLTLENKLNNMISSLEILKDYFCASKKREN